MPTSDTENPRCPWTARATEYVRGELAAAELRRFETHLPSCPRCREDVRDLGELIEELLRNEVCPARYVGNDLSERILAKVPESPPASRWIVFSAAAAVCAMAAILGFVGFGSVDTEVRVRELSNGSRAGSSESARTLLRARDWLASVQERDGSWDPQRWGGDAAFRIALTGLASLALSGDGRPSTAAAISRAGEFLVRSQRADGHLGDPSRTSLYNHAIGTLALVEITGAQEKEGSAEAAERALRFLRDAQTPRGAWGYSSEAGTLENESISVWAFEAMVRARSFGLSDHRPAIAKAVEWFELALSQREKHAIRYVGRGAHVCGSQPSPMAIAALLLGDAPHASHIVRRVLDDLLRHSDGARSTRFCFYDSYFLSKTGCLSDISALERECLETRQVLVDSQVRDGPLSGSWEPSDRWSSVGGRLYTTALATLALRDPVTGSGDHGNRRG